MRKEEQSDTEHLVRASLVGRRKMDAQNDRLPLFASAKMFEIDRACICARGCHQRADAIFCFILHSRET
jgi:hypothetical protein